MKGITFLHPALYVDKTKEMGRGVFTKEDLREGTVLEISPVIVMSGKDWKLLDQTKLHDYIFKWGKAEKQCCMALGYIPMYNHSYSSNCDYQMNFRQHLMAIITVKEIAAGDELLINYNGEWNDATPLWFDAK
jgi:SET domain-containing protein